LEAPIRELGLMALLPHPILRNGSATMGRYALLWLLGVPIPILLLIYLFGGLN
jgi:hypothetical protein